MVATRTGLVARREAIEIVHGLGATDSYIAGRFARRASSLAAIGGAVGAFAALPVLLGLATLAAPFLAGDPAAAAQPRAGDGQALLAWGLGVLRSLPPEIWAALPLLPVIAWTIGFATAQGTVRRWLRRLP
jgi:cell division transport system permease protein